MFCSRCGYNLFGSDECNRCTGLVDDGSFRTKSVQVPADKRDLICEILALIDPDQKVNVSFRGPINLEIGLEGFYIFQFDREELFDPTCFNEDFKYLCPVFGDK